MSKLVKDIEKNQTSENANEEIEQTSNDKTWLVFSAHEKLYAIEAPMAKEILRNMEIYAIPFVPDFIKGVINRHGEPYTVVDLAAFLEGDQIESSLFIVLNLSDTKFCIQISDILDFHTASEDSIIQMADTQDAGFYCGTIEYHEKNVPIIQINKVYDVIRTDLENQR